ncbi:type II toxin-antitoxin system HigB family toxin [Gemmata sp. JC673]|uniref:Type II toxin-antitoxin system HigB family toxin n=1 Tax=Gemmata algarum TaxID=2975278 RepID=A0ABU5EVI3_9BACT|nr:type II toxin-antitoxin system HigB family toxin [Gemmata algarum]MDY3558979.1 type II toxin-antitoxin system HigB family toxin [Gemmata algarum]
MSFQALQDFWAEPQSPAGCEPHLRAWYAAVEAATWRNFAELRQMFRSTDKVGDCYVFDVWNNNIRLVAFVRFADAPRGGLVLVRKVMTHSEYDKNDWPDECGCHKARPKGKGPRPTRSPKAKRSKK